MNKFYMLAEILSLMIKTIVYSLGIMTAILMVTIAIRDYYHMKHDAVEVIQESPTPEAPKYVITPEKSA